MLIDWFTVIAQALNFLILVWLMKRFLYQPILNAIAARDKHIATELADADAKQAEAKKERDDFLQKNEEFDQQRATLFSKATTDAVAERQRLFDEARNAADAMSTKRQESLRNDARNLNLAISRRTRQEVFAIARKTLTDLAGTTLEERMVEVFTRRLREMDDKAKADLAGALKTAPEPALVRSTFDLTEEQRAAIQNALNETFSAATSTELITSDLAAVSGQPSRMASSSIRTGIKLRFETAPDQVSGIELTANGQKLAWSIADYLTSLEKGVEELLKEKVEAQAQVMKPTVLTQQIGKRAYELYEEHGHQEGLAAQDWEQAEHEIRKEIPEPVKAKPRPASKVELKSEAKVEAETAAKPKPEIKPEAIAMTEPKAVVKPEKKVEPKPPAKVQPKPEEFKPESKSP